MLGSAPVAVAHPVLGDNPSAVPHAVVEEEQPEAGVVDRPRVEPALHLLEPGALGVEVPGGVGFGAERLPEPRGHEVGDRRSRHALQYEPEQQWVVVVVLPRYSGRLLDSGLVQREVPQVHSVVRVRVVAERRKAALPVADARRHGEQVAQRDLSELGISRRQLGEVVGHRILDASDQPLVDRDPDERRHERLRGGERGLQALASSAVEVALAGRGGLRGRRETRACPSRAGARRAPSRPRSRRGRPRRRREEDSRGHLPVSASQGICAGRPRPTRARPRPERTWTRRSTTTPSVHAEHRDDEQPKTPPASRNHRRTPRLAVIAPHRCSCGGDTVHLPALPVGAEKPADPQEHDSGDGHADARAEHRPVEPEGAAVIEQVDDEPHQTEGDPDPEHV